MTDDKQKNYEKMYKIACAAGLNSYQKISVVQTKC